MTASPWTIEVLRAMRGEPLIKASTEYIALHEADIREARRLRDGAVAALADEVGPAEAARRTDLSLSSVRVIRKTAQP